jgi:hypothetical protein
MSARGRQLQPIRLMSFQGGEHEIKLFGDFDARGGLLLIEVPSIDFTATWAPTPKRGWRSWPPPISISNGADTPANPSQPSIFA